MLQMTTANSNDDDDDKDSDNGNGVDNNNCIDYLWLKTLISQKLIRSQRQYNVECVNVLNRFLRYWMMMMMMMIAESMST